VLRQGREGQLLEQAVEADAEAGDGAAVVEQAGEAGAEAEELAAGVE